MGNETNGGPREPGSGRPGEQTDAGDGIEIRAIGEDEVEAWDRALVKGFLRPHVGPAAEFRRRQWEPGRMSGALADGRFVATFRSFDTELTVPGGATVTADAITAVTVTATHRRRGLLRRMMTADLEAARERGVPVAILIAAEYNIYGRYGFGPATRGHGWNIDLLRAGGLRDGLPTVPGGRIDLVEMAELRKIGPELFDRWRVTQAGAIARDELTWQRSTGEIEVPGFDWKEPFAAVHRDADGTPTGLAVYRIDDEWDGSYPNCTLTLVDLFALDRPTATELWRFVCSIDWVRKVVVENIGPDDPLPVLLNDPRGRRRTSTTPTTCGCGCSTSRRRSTPGRTARPAARCWRSTTRRATSRGAGRSRSPRTAPGAASGRPTSPIWRWTPRRWARSTWAARRCRGSPWPGW